MLINFMHIPKTGGTSFTYILEKIFIYPDKSLRHILFKNDVKTVLDKTKHSAKNIHLLIRSSQDFLILDKYKSKLKKFNNIILEGNVLGLNTLNNKQINHKIISLRNPFNIFKSNFTYGKIRYMVNNEQDYINTYGPNLLTNTIGYGNLELAKDRVQNYFTDLMILEKFDDSLKLFLNKLNIKKINYNRKNKSSSEKFAFSKCVEEEFMDKNQKDLELFEFAYNLQKQRIKKEKLKSIKVLQKFDPSSFQKGHYRSDSRVIKAIENNQNKVAINILKLRKNKNFQEFFALAKLYKEEKDYKNAFKNYNTALKYQHDVVFNEFLTFSMKFFPDHAEYLLEQEIKINKLIKMDSFSFEDNPVNRELVYLYSVFIKFLLKQKNYSKAMKEMKNYIEFSKDKFRNNFYPNFHNMDELIKYYSIIIYYKNFYIKEAKNSLNYFIKKDKNMRKFSLKENLYWIRIDPIFFIFLILKRPLIKLLN